MPEASLSAISELLAQWRAGRRKAFRPLIPLPYAELHQVAHRYLHRGCCATLQTTALVHEAYLRLEQHHLAQFENRAQFVAICASLMGQILIGHERTRRAAKRGAGGENLALDRHAVVKGRPNDLIALDDALNDLARLNPQQSRMVEVQFFGSLSIEEVMGISPATVKRHWTTARPWLHREITRIRRWT